MMLRHDAPIAVTIITDDDRVLDRTVVRADMVDTHLTIRAYMHGMVNGMDTVGAKGARFEIAAIMVLKYDLEGNLVDRLQYTLELQDEAYRLDNGALCPCDTCVPTNE